MKTRAKLNSPASPDRLPVPTQLPVLDLNQPAQVAQWLLAQGERFEYHWDQHGGLL